MRFGVPRPQVGTGVAALGTYAVMVGYFQGTVPHVPAVGPPSLSAGGDDAFVARIDAGGQSTWWKTFGSPGNQRAAAVATDGSSTILVIGSFEGAIDLGGGPLQSAGGDDLFVAKLDGSGNHVWSKRFGGAGDQRGASVALDGAGNAFIAGHFAGSLDLGGGALQSAGGDDLFVAKLDGSGNHVWSKRFGDAADQSGV
ncbi:MAG: hypothetical protein IT372_01690, partial [Polyangiaceae bacterium]|nr:hypothetical protein [Polyangiaceae bacterium]